MKTALITIGSIILIAILVPCIFYVSLILWGDWHDDWSGYTYSGYLGNGVCNIAVVPVLGEMHTSGKSYDDFGTEQTSTSMTETVAMLQKAEREEGIYGVLLMVDSGGGSPAAGELIATELQNSQLPNAAYVLDRAASSAYLAASGADYIFASPFADVGSLGITMSYLENSKQNTQEGLEYVSLTSAKFKDYGSTDKPLTEEERALIERDLAIWHEELIQQVATNRQLPVEQVARLADGSSMPSKLALENNLIDEIGNKKAIKAWFANKLETSPDNIIFCE